MNNLKTSLTNLTKKAEIMGKIDELEALKGIIEESIIDYIEEYEKIKKEEIEEELEKNNE